MQPLLDRPIPEEHTDPILRRVRPVLRSQQLDRARNLTRTPGEHEPLDLAQRSNLSQCDVLERLPVSCDGRFQMVVVVSLLPQPKQLRFDCIVDELSLFELANVLLVSATVP